MTEWEIPLTFPLLKFCAYSLIFCAFIVANCYTQLFEGPRIDKEVILWKKGDNGVAYYRIPIITALPDGTLLALSEARKHGSSDSGPKFLAIRQSQDLGTTWSPTSFIEDDKEAADGLNLGSIIVDGETGTVFKTKDPQKGRLITCGHSSGADEGMYCVVSDDHGVTWKVAAVLPRMKNFDANECQLVELNDGSILLTARNELQEECHCRIMAKSYDACESFLPSDIYFDKTLIDPTVAASLLNYNSVLYFSNPANQYARINMTVRWSGDQGETWKGALNIWKAASGYSCLTAIPSTQTNKTFIGLVFEKGILVYYESILFVRIEV